MRDLAFITLLPAEEQEIIWAGPALQPPPGVISNFTTPSNRNEIGYSIVIAAAILSTAIVSARIYALCWHHRKVAIEDFCVVAALGIFGGFLACIIAILKHPGIYVHQWDVRLKDMPHILYNMQTGSTLYRVIIMLIKVCILLEWVEIFVPKGFRNRFWWTCHVLLVVNVAFHIACTIVEIFPCRPREKFWKLAVAGKCLDVASVNVVSAVFNFVSDVIIFALPQATIWKLKTSTPKKIGIATIFALGLLATVATAARIASTIKFARSDDILFTASEMGMWCTVEITAGFLVFCMPTMPKLFADSPWVRKIFSSFTTSKFTKPKEQDITTIGGGRPTKRVKREADASLFTDSDANDTTFLTSALIVEAGQMGMEEVRCAK